MMLTTWQSCLLPVGAFRLVPLSLSRIFSKVCVQTDKAHVYLVQELETYASVVVDPGIQDR